MANEVAKRTASTVKEYLAKNKAAIQLAMPQGANYERFCRTVINAISTTPSIAECTADSIFLSCIKAFSVGIEPNGPTQEGYLVPFKDHGTAKAQFMPSYRGLVSLARRSGMVSLIYADVIREGDKYRISRGTDPKLEHEPAFNDGKPLYYYAVAKMSDGSMAFDVMTLANIEGIRKRSKAKDSGPWTTDFDEMAKKTVIKRLAKSLPMSVENLAFAKAVQHDNKAEAGEDDVIDVEGIEVPPEPKSPFATPPPLPPALPKEDEKPKAKKEKPAAQEQAPATEPGSDAEADEKAQLQKLFDGAFISKETLTKYLRVNVPGFPLTINWEDRPDFRKKVIENFDEFQSKAADWAANQESK